MVKYLTAILIAGSIFQAHATEMIVHYSNALNYELTYFQYGSFEFNDKNSSAWTVLSFESSAYDNQSAIIKVQIPNMQFDDVRREVVIDTDTGRIVCAFEKKDFFGTRYLKNTNNCKFQESFSTVAILENSKVRKIRKRTITFTY